METKAIKSVRVSRKLSQQTRRTFSLGVSPRKVNPARGLKPVGLAGFAHLPVWIIADGKRVAGHIESGDLRDKGMTRVRRHDSSASVLVEETYYSEGAELDQVWADIEKGW